MASVNVTMRFDQEMKAQFDNVLSIYGLTFSQAIKLFANQAIKTQRIPLNFDYFGQNFNATTLQAIEDARNGKVHQVKSYDELMRELNED